jgi:hypothetical protein
MSLTELYDGALGFEQQGNSFLNQLKNAGQIDHEIISFYTSSSGFQSWVKFGSIDQSAF